MAKTVTYTHYGTNVELPIAEINTINRYGRNLEIVYKDGESIKASGCHDFVEMMATVAMAINNSYVEGWRDCRKKFDSWM